MKKILCCMENHQVADLMAIRSFIEKGVGKKNIVLGVDSLLTDDFSIAELWVKGLTQAKAVQIMHFLTDCNTIRCNKSDVDFEIWAEGLPRVAEILEIRDGGHDKATKAMWANIPSLQGKVLPKELLPYVKTNESVTFSIGKGEQLVCIGKKALQLAELRRTAKIEEVMPFGVTPSFAWF